MSESPNVLERKKVAIVSNDALIEKMKCHSLIF